jgi:hypothetical protein
MKTHPGRQTHARAAGQKRNSLRDDDAAATAAAFRKTVERNRRNQMNALYSRLDTLVRDGSTPVRGHLYIIYACRN